MSWRRENPDDLTTEKLSVPERGTNDMKAANHSFVPYRDGISSGTSFRRVSPDAIEFVLFRDKTKFNAMMFFGGLDSRSLKTS